MTAALDKPELIRDMSFAEYINRDAVNATKLLTYKGQSAFEAKHEQDHPGDDTSALTRGHAAHAAILQPDVFDAVYATEPDFGNLRTNAGKEARDTWRAAHRDRVTLTPDDKTVAMNVKNSILKGPLASMFTGDGVNELTILWTDEPTGLRCKARVDRLTTWKNYQCLIDLKTARGISDGAIGKAIVDFNYHVRMAFYVEALKQAGYEPTRVILAWCLNSEPWATRATDLLENDLAEGAAWWRKLLDLHARCVTEGEWPGYGDCPEPIGLPKWAYSLTQPKGE